MKAAQKQTMCLSLQLQLRFFQNPEKCDVARSCTKLSKTSIIYKRNKLPDDVLRLHYA